MNKNDRYKLAMTLQVACKRLVEKVGPHILKDGVASDQIKVIRNVAKVLDNNAIVCEDCAKEDES